MARKLRLEYPGAIYQVMNRGDRLEPIFLDDQDGNASWTRSARRGLKPAGGRMPIA